MQLPAALQLSHDPAQAEVQQTPSAQNPLVQSVPAPHVAPNAFFGMQAPLWQKKPFAHCWFEVHVAGQLALVPSHARGEQEGAPEDPAAATVHVPALPVNTQLSHAPAHAVLQQTPSTHCEDAHSAALVHAVPFCSFGTQAPPLQ